ncbi:hypothetical protein [Nocardioides mesophilus]|uniref:Uncharacterized protein n=1 Tax=Nocardioides mesophilus TaxID=433659 RepID=A0A7G9RES7_9ACTN|nr:hypothetical protein [Nocardioides mesophilus]QNN54102.1 hypothetical protein H9L09_06930 [Nocardioides mesophilus]
MRNLTHRRPVRASLSLMAVSSLTVAGLSMSAAAPANAESDPARQFTASAQATGLTSKLAVPMTQFDKGVWIGVAFGHVSATSDGDARASMGQGVQSSPAAPENTAVNAEHVDPVQGPGPITDSSPATTVGGEFTIGAASTSAQTDFPAAGLCTPAGVPMTASTLTTDSLDVEPYDYLHDPRTAVDLVDLLTPETVTSSTRMITNGQPGMRGVVSTSEYSGARYSLLNGTVKVTASAAKMVTTADGVNPSTFEAVDSVITVEERNGKVTVLAPGSRTRYIDPANPNASIDLIVSMGASGYEMAENGTTANSYAPSFAAQFTDSQFGTVGSVTAGTLYADIKVPVGGVDCSHPIVPDDDADGLTNAEESTLGTDPNDPDTDRDRLSDLQEVTGSSNGKYGNLATDPTAKDSDEDGLGDGREVLGIDTVRLSNVKTDPNVRDTDGDRLKDGVEVRGFTNTLWGRTLKSHPLRVDTDKDGLRDRQEVTGSRNDKFGNEPTSAWRNDADGDGAHDLDEIRAGSNPADRTSRPRTR